MIIGIDGNEANVEQKVGVNKQAFEILWGLHRESLKVHDSHKLQDNNIDYIVYLKNSPRSDLPKENAHWKYKLIPGSGFWVLTKLTCELWFGNRPDVFFTPSHYLPILAPVPMVCMICDLGYLKFSAQFKKFDYWQLKIWTAISIIVSEYIIAVSENTKKDIVRHYKFASNKVRVVHLGPDSEKYNLTIDKKFVRQIIDKYRITKKYIIFMSTLKPSKNVEALIDAFAGLKKNNYQLVMVGKKGWLYQSIFKRVKRNNIIDKVIFTDWLPDDERAALLSGAEVFVLPSFWEGFGIDILNSFSVGTPVVASRVASIPEIAGKAAIYIDPDNVQSIRVGLEQALNMSKKEYNTLVQAGFIQLQKFSWTKSSMQTLEVIKKAYLNT